MKNLKQQKSTNSRNSSIELLKVFGIILIVISHVIQSLYAQNSNITVNEYILNISMASTNIQHLVLALLRYCGALGNTVFFCCSAWFLLNDDNINKKKILQMILDVWIISTVILTTVFIIRGGNISLKMVIKQILPITFENNWYITCYLLFYPLHPFLNRIIKSMKKHSLLKTTLVLLFLYVGMNFVRPGSYFSTHLTLWVTLYFAIAYVKFYLVGFANNIKSNILTLVIGFIGNTGIVLLTNFLGLRFELFSNWLLKWNTNCNPFIILMAFSMVNIANNIHFKNRFVNYISSLSLLIYIIHENELLRTFYRPLIWNYIFQRFGYDYILLWTFVLVVIVLSFGIIASVVYKSTIQKVVTIVCNAIYPILRKIYHKAEKTILRLK